MHTGNKKPHKIHPGASRPRCASARGTNYTWLTARMQREKRKRGHEATPRETRIIEREKRKRDQDASRGSFVSSAISRQTRMRQNERANGEIQRGVGQIVSLALYDGDKMLFACSGVAIQPITTMRPELSRFVTSKRLVTEFEVNRNRADKLRIIVCLPDKERIDGFLGLYDSHVAIVTCFCSTGVLPVDLHSHIQGQHAPLVAIGRAFSSGTLMTTDRRLTEFRAEGDLILFPCPITEAGLGGPVIDLAGEVLGLSIDIVNETTLILPLMALRERLEYLDKFIPNSTNFREYTLPEDLKIYIMAGGYPKPPPLMLEVCGRLLDTFEEVFGQLLAYKGCCCNINDRTSGEEVWAELPKGVVTKISRRVVTLSSYDGDVRAFACIGLIIKQGFGYQSKFQDFPWLPRISIKVFLPPKQVVDGTLELCHADYNIAVISVQKCLYGIRPENIFRRVKRPRREVVAIGRDVDDGLLMGTIGKVIKTPAGRTSKLNCEDLKLSTCKIKKAGIGGPLVNFVNGSFAGMNFYDRTNRTPYLPRRFIVRALSRIDLPSQRGLNHPIDIMGDAAPVPKPYWYHRMFDDEPPLRFVGRVLH
ncbi:hypothetical protein VPH35_112581 [Triticum aestivum]